MVLLALYWQTLLPGVVGGDAGELQFAGPLLALVHPTGQPLYVLMGKLWSVVIPFGTVAWKLNLLAAVCTAAGGASLTWLIFRIYRNLPIGIIAGLVLGLGATVWGQAVLADKYGFNVFLAVWIVGLAVWWSREYDTPHGDRLLVALSVAFGVGLLHHRSLGLFAVGIGIMVVFRLRAELWRKPRRTLICAACVLLPALIVYPTVLPLLRANEATPLLWQPTSPADWVNFLMERHVISGEALVFDDTAQINRQLDIYIDTLLADYTVLVPLIAAIGAVWMLRVEPLTAVFLLVSYGLQAFLSANFRGNDRQFTYYLPSFVTLMPLFSYGLWQMWRTLDGWLTSRRFRSLVTGGALVIVLGLPLAQWAAAYPDQRQTSQQGIPLTYDDDIWRRTLKAGDTGQRLADHMAELPPQAVVASDWEQVTILWYMQQVEGIRPDLTLVYPIDRYQDYLTGDQPVCLARHLPVDPTWHPSNVGAFICLADSPRTAPPSDIIPAQVALYTPAGDRVLDLMGYTGEPTTHPAGGYIPVTTYWQAQADLAHEYSVSLQILREDWSLVTQRDILHPVMGLYATTHWEPGEVVGDFHEIPIPSDQPPGRYLWTLVVYRALPDGGFEALQDADGNTNILGGTFEVHSGTP